MMSILLKQKHPGFKITNTITVKGFRLFGVKLLRKRLLTVYG